MHRTSTSWVHLSLFGSLALAAAAGCGAMDDGADSQTEDFRRGGSGRERAPREPAMLPGTDQVAFREGLEAFAEAETIVDGLGPTFNEDGCGTCHTSPGVGGSGEQIERRFGRMENGVFFAYDSDEENQGGTLRQLSSVPGFRNGDSWCRIPVETEPPTANVRNVGRRTQPLFGLGLVDAMPDAFFDALAAAQPASVRGIAQRVRVTLPDPRDPSQSIGSLRVGRFGWKGLVPTLLVFAGDAYDNEMGITTQSCFRGTSVLEFAMENHPNNVAPPAGCNGGDMAPAHPPGVADVPEYTDDVVGPCTGGRTEIQDDLILFTTFMERLAPLPRNLPTRDRNAMARIERGERAFSRIGCAGCHVGTTFRTPANPWNGVPGGFAFRPYSDFLVHDMGSLGDGIGQTGDPEAQTRLMRTQPLWGARWSASYLHDGRAGDIREAILEHAGQGAESRNNFRALSRDEQSALIEFVRSL